MLELDVVLHRQVPSTELPQFSQSAQGLSSHHVPHHPAPTSANEALRAIPSTNVPFWQCLEQTHSSPEVFGCGTDAIVQPLTLQLVRGLLALNQLLGPHVAPI